MVDTGEFFPFQILLLQGDSQDLRKHLRNVRTPRLRSSDAESVGPNDGDCRGRRDHRAAAQVGLVAEAALHNVHGRSRKVQD